MECFWTNLDDVWQCLEELHEFGVAVIGDATLSTEVVVVRRNELAERHATSGERSKEVNHFATELIHLV